MPLLGITVNVKRLILTCMIHLALRIGYAIDYIGSIKRYSLYIGPVQLTLGWSLRQLTDSNQRESL